jgi:hypothetical protein
VVESTPSPTNLTTTSEVLHALDNLSPANDSLATRNGYFIHVRGIYPHLAGIGNRGGIDTHHSRPKSNLARVGGSVGLRLVCRPTTSCSFLQRTALKES